MACFACFSRPSEPADAFPAALPSALQAPLPDLAPYKAIRQIGRGAVGEVFLARHGGDRQLYAVKTVPLDAPSWRLELLKREERMYAALATDAGAHVGLLRPCRMQLLPDRLCLVTEWASGGTLAAFLSSPRYAGGVDEQTAAFLMRQLLAAVERLHIHRVAYRDIKLDNILLDTETFGPKVPRVLLADFGTCKAWEEGEAGCLTQTFMGTPGFMAPQVLGLLSLNGQGPPGAPPGAAAGPPGAAREGSESGMDDSAAMSASPSQSDCSSSSLSSGDEDEEAAARNAAAVPPAAEGSGHGGGGGGGGAGAAASANGGGNRSGRMYDAVKADIYSMGAILSFLLFKELPYGFDKFAHLLPPREALETLWALECRQSWREAAGTQLARRGASRAAIDLLDRMLAPDEADRIDVAGIKAHPWMQQKLPRRYQSALDQLASDQAELDMARRALLDRSTRARRSIGALGAVDAACAAASAFAAAAAGAAAGAPPPSAAAAASGRAPSAVETALENLFSASGDPAAMRRLQDRGVSLFVDVTPTGVFEAWELGVQTEPLRPGRALRRAASARGGQRGPRGCSPPRGRSPRPSGAFGPASGGGGGDVAGGSGDLGAWYLGPGGTAAGAAVSMPMSVAGRSDSATSTDLPSAALGACCDKAAAAFAAEGGGAAAVPAGMAAS